MIKIGIIGGAGYTAGELIRLLLNHPEIEIKFVNSTSNAGNKLYSVHEGLIGETEMEFSSDHPLEKIDLLFMCCAHGESKKFIESNYIPEKLKIIDLSMDYRKEYEGNEFVYGLPELNKKKIQNARYIANPGCFATAIQLGLLPLAAAGLLKNETNITAITGSTGAGVKPGETKHFSWRDNNLSVYKAFTHQHLVEIKQSLGHLQKDFNEEINFIPVRGDFPRGIFASMYTKCNLEQEEIKNLYKGFYKDAVFTFISETNPDLKQVVNTNKCILYLEKYKDKLLILSIIDNLLKGASGQALQNLNILYGLKENTGLGLKASAF